MICS
jgi:hypothetical protein